MNKLTHEQQYSIYCYYLGNNFKLGVAYLSPLSESVRGKKDRFSSFNIYETASGNLRWKDFGGGGEMSGDAIDFIKVMESDIQAMPKQKQFKAAMQFFQSNINGNRLIKGDIILEQMNRHQLARSNKIDPIPYYDQEFTKRELSFWDGHPLHIGLERLKSKRIHALRGIDWGNGLTYPSTSEDPAFLFDLSEQGDMSSWKAYRPLTKNKRHKWKSWNLSDIPFEGYYLLPETGDNLIFTSGKKDGIVGEIAMIEDEMEWSFGNPTAEGSFRAILPYQNELNSRFTNIYVLFDGDKAGRKATQEFTKITGWIPLYVYYPLKTGKRLKKATTFGERQHTKDITEVVENYNYRVLYKLIKDAINNFNLNRKK